MRTFNIYKAQTIGAHMTVDSTNINISEELPEYEATVEYEAIFEKEALTLAGALLSALPGGTIDRLIAELLRRKATSFVIPLFGRANVGEDKHLPYGDSVLPDEERRRIVKILVEELDKMNAIKEEPHGNGE